MRLKLLLLSACALLLAYSYIVHPTYAALPDKKLYFALMVPYVAGSLLVLDRAYSCIEKEKVRFDIDLKKAPLAAGISLLTSYAASSSLSRFFSGAFLLCFVGGFLFFIVMLSGLRGLQLNRNQKLLVFLALVFLLIQVPYISAPLVIPVSDEGVYVDLPINLVKYFTERIESVDSLQKFVQHGTVPTPIVGIAYILFGLNLVGIRLASVAFTMMAAAYVYGIVKLFRDEDAALASAALFLFFPSTYIYAGRMMLVSGLVFFVAAVSYHLLKYLRDGSVGALAISAVIYSASLLFRKELIVLFPILAAYCAIFHWKKLVRKESLLFVLTPFLLYLPIMVVRGIYNRTGQGALEAALVSPFSPVLYAEANRLSFPFLVLAHQLTVPFFLVVLLGLLQKRDEVWKYAYSFFVGWYALFSLVQVLQSRYLAPFAFAASLVSGSFFRERKVLGAAVLFLAVSDLLIGLYGFFPFMDKTSDFSICLECVRGDRTTDFIGMPSVSFSSMPIEEALVYLKEANAKSVLGAGIYGFYMRKNGFTGFEFESVGEGTPSEPDALYGYCKEKGIEYVVLSPNLWDGKCEVYPEKVASAAVSRPDLFDVRKFEGPCNDIVVAKVV